MSSVGFFVLSLIAFVIAAIKDARDSSKSLGLDSVDDLQNERKIFQAFPLPESQSNSLSDKKRKKTKKHNAKCPSCNAEMQYQDGILICQYCQTKVILPDSVQLQIEKSRMTAYTEVEKGKQDSYTRIAIEREKTKRKHSSATIFSENFGLIILFSMFIVCAGLGSRNFISESKRDHSNEAKVPMAYTEYEGVEYTIVIDALRSVGFTNITTKELGDLTTGWMKKENTVDTIYIAGNSKFQKDTWYPKDAEIIIVYHSFSE